MGLGTWAWGNQLLWGYQQEMDTGLQETFNLAVRNGINLFDTADSYGTGRLNGQSERLLGKFIQEYPGIQFCSGVDSVRQHSGSNESQNFVSGPKGTRESVVIATKFAAYPWRLTPGQFVQACKYSG